MMEKDSSSFFKQTAMNKNIIQEVVYWYVCVCV